MDYYKCRLCLEDTTRYVDIFRDTFSEMIEILAGIKMNPYDGLPTTSCLQCHQDVKSAMLVRYQIINSNKILLEEIEELKNNKPKKVELEEPSNNTSYEMDIKTSPNDDNNYDSPDDNFSESRLPINNEQIDNKNTPEKEVRFRKKSMPKPKSGDQIEFKKRKTPADGLSVKIEYNLKANHLEFLKTLGRKDRVACPECGRVMFGMNMKNHLITHNFDPVICDICGKTSKNAQALQDHINYYHKTTPDRFMCDKCGKGYRVRCMLEKHEKKEHGNGQKDFECTVCGKKFFEKLHLKNHINITHNKVKAYKCEHCGKDFGRRTQFVTHQLVHTKENRYHCQVCGKGFKIKQTLQTHLKGVHGIEEEKTIFCKICQKGFSTPQGLRAHINSRVHGLEKCEHCSEYITVEYKGVHLRDVHGIKSEGSFS